MEENKKVDLEKANANGQGQGGGRKRRKHRRGRGGNGNGGNNPPQNQQAQNAQAAQNGQQQNAKQAQPQAQKQSQKQQQNNNAAQGGKNKKQKQQQNAANTQNSNKDENRKDTYLYTLDGNLYVNLTNKCSNGCDFCVRNERTSYYGNYLWLRHGDPTAEKVIAAANGMGDLSRFKEVVFCGFGEPTYKVAEMVALCDYFHEKGLSTRLNTNGQGNLINKRDIVPDLKGKIDFVNISLNASCYEKYQPICRSQFGESGFAGMIEFAKLCKRSGVACRFSIVDCIGEEEVEACKRLADSVKIPLYVRKYIADS
ncbi:MAG: radical SAM protein [Clostridia bacterium]|nr:radical SAM protein [Clostridia bacterium]